MTNCLPVFGLSGYSSLFRVDAYIYTSNQVRKILTWFLVVYEVQFRELVLLTILKKGNIINYTQILDSNYTFFTMGIK